MVRVAASMVRCFPVALLPRCVHSGRNNMLLFGRHKVLLGVAVLDSRSVRSFVQYVAVSENPKTLFGTISTWTTPIRVRCTLNTIT